MSFGSFNINPHYLDPNPQIKHNGEIRETTINEFLTQKYKSSRIKEKGNWIRRIDKITRKEQSHQDFEKEKKNLMNWSGNEL